MNRFCARYKSFGGFFCFVFFTDVYTQTAFILIKYLHEFMSTFTHTKSREQWRHVYIYGWNCNSVRGVGERTDWWSKQEYWTSILFLCCHLAVTKSECCDWDAWGAAGLFVGPWLINGCPWLLGPESRPWSFYNSAQAEMRWTTE